MVYNLEDRFLSINIGLVLVSLNSIFCCVVYKFLVKNCKLINNIYCKLLLYVDSFFLCFKGFRLKLFLKEVLL